MPEYPSYRGRYEHIEKDTAKFGVGYDIFTIEAYGLRNLLHMLLEMKASLDYAIVEVNDAIQVRAE